MPPTMALFDVAVEQVTKLLLRKVWDAVQWTIEMRANVQADAQYDRVWRGNGWTAHVHMDVHARIGLNTGAD